MVSQVSAKVGKSPVQARHFLFDFTHIVEAFITVVITVFHADAHAPLAGVLAGWAPLTLPIYAWAVFALLVTNGTTLATPDTDRVRACATVE